MYSTKVYEQKLTINLYYYFIQKKKNYNFKNKKILFL